jgi:hypothetical protein
LLDQLDTAAIDVESLTVRPADLDDVFLSLTGAGAKEKDSTP